jgi:1,2-diacylglycerol 3-alpha-glucosyltransferase
MRIAIFTNNYLPRVSGVAVAVNFQETALRKLGHQTLVIAPDYAISEEPSQVKVVRVKSLAFTSQRFAIPLNFLDRGVIEEELGRFNPDLIHTHHPFLLGKTALEAADQLQVPLIYTFHTLYDMFAHYFMMDTEPVRKQVRDYVVHFCNCCDLVLIPTEPIRKYMVENGVNTRTEAMPTGIDFTRFEHISKSRLRKRTKQHQLDRFSSVLFYAGRISREKNLSLVIRALKRLKDQARNPCLLIAGKGPAQRALEREAVKLGIDNRVLWLGFVDQKELPEYYYLADLFVFPSNSDTQGIVLYEARAAGLPIVALDSMASRAIIKDGESGLFAKDDARDFAKKVAEVLDHHEKFNAPFNRNEYSSDTLIKRLEAFYQEMSALGRSRQARALGTIFFPFFNPP